MSKVDLWCTELVFRTFFKVLLEKLVKKSIRSPKGCQIWQGCPNSRYGKQRVTFPGHAETIPRVHVLVLMCVYKETRPRPGMEASHLWHERKCVEPAHLVWEPGYVNERRNDCKRLGLCNNEHAPRAAFRVLTRMIFSILPFKPEMTTPKKVNCFLK